MAKYKVLWFDDEWDELEDILESAKSYDIELVGVNNAKEGLKLLQQDVHLFQGVILDGKFFLDETKTGDEVNDDAFDEVAKFLHDLHVKGEVLPWFILSGQKNFTKEVNRGVKNFGETAYSGGRVFDKLEGEDSELFESLVKEIENTPLLRLYVKHKEVFKTCNDQYLGKDQENRFFEILKAIELNEFVNSEDQFAALRKVLERMTEKLSMLGAIPNDLTLNDLKRFSGKWHSSYEIKDEIFPPIIVHTLNSVIDLVQDASHLKEDLKLKVDQHIKDANISYLYPSTALSVLEIVVWFKKFVDLSPDYETNRNRWALKIDGEYIGKLAQDASGNYHVDNYLLPYSKVDNVFELGMKLMIETSIDNKKLETMAFYPKFANKFRKLD